ncbi:MAG: DNA primase [Bifidobacteriaceae bacterium]|jgi:hypothetical protein|nr:DNA primase [Bifidobacteriaceae bacterium]
MTVEPRAALDRLIASLESHHAAAASGRGVDDPSFISAYVTLIDAFETYDEALYEATGIDTPFLVYDDGDEDDEDEDFEDDEEDDEDFEDDEDEDFEEIILIEVDEVEEE